MRTESPIGGGSSSHASPSLSFGNSSNRMITKSPRDIYTAMVISRPRGFVLDASCSYEPTSRRVTDGECATEAGMCRSGRDVDERESTKTDVLPRFAHIKSAVMPERHSFVQKALKRKIENRLESSFGGQAVEVRVPRESIEKAIESERGYFDCVKRCRLQSELESTKSEDVGGRFIRTGQPCRAVDDVYRKVSCIDVSPYMIKRQGGTESNRCPDGSSVGKYTADDMRIVEHNSSRKDNVLRQEVYSPEIEHQISMPKLQPIISSYQSHSLQCNNIYEQARTDVLHQQAEVNIVAGRSTLVGSASGGRVSCANDSRLPIPVQSACGTLQFGREMPQYHHRLGRTSDADRKKNESLSAYYSLGRQFASALTSPARLPVLNGQRTLNPAKKFSQHFESRDTSALIKQEGMTKFRGSHVTNENKKVRVLDSRTEKKVKSGEFGTLKTLQAFYNKLPSQNSDAGRKQYSRGRLGSITNYSPITLHRHAKNGDLSDRCMVDIKSDANEETAIDLSVHNRRAHSDVEEQLCNRTSRYESHRQVRATRRKSRSCCSSPSLGMDLVKRDNADESIALDRKPRIETEKMIVGAHRWSDWTTTSLPSSPFSVQKSVNVKCESLHKELEDKCSQYSSERIEIGSDKLSAEMIVAKADSRLPLKKRRLLDVGNLSPSPPAEISNAFEEQKPMAVKREPSTSQDGANADVQCDSLSALVSAIIRGDEDGDLPLHIAIAQGNLVLVDRILDIMLRLDMSLDRYNNLRQTPLHVAVLTDQPDIVRRLLKGGASPNIVDRNGLTSIHHAAKLPNSHCLDCLIEHSAVPLDMNALTYDGQTALHLAVQYNKLPAVMSLVEAGARIDACDGTNGRTPLFYAVEQNNVPVAKILLAGGANPSMPTYSGCSPAQIAFAPRCRKDVSRLIDVYVAADVKG